MSCWRCCCKFAVASPPLTPPPPHPHPLFPNVCHQMAYADYPLTPDYDIRRGTLVFPSINAANMQGWPEAHRFDPERMGPERKEDITYAKNYLTFGYGPHYCVGEWPPWVLRGNRRRAGGAAGLPPRLPIPFLVTPHPCFPFAPFLPFPVAPHPLPACPPAPPLTPRTHTLAGKEYAVNQLVLFLAILSTECDWTRQRTPNSDKMQCEGGGGAVGVGRGGGGLR